MLAETALKRHNQILRKEKLIYGSCLKLPEDKDSKGKRGAQSQQDIYYM